MHNLGRGLGTQGELKHLNSNDLLPFQPLDCTLRVFLCRRRSLSKSFVVCVFGRFYTSISFVEGPAQESLHSRALVRLQISALSKTTVCHCRCTWGYYCQSLSAEGTWSGALEERSTRFRLRLKTRSGLNRLLPATGGYGQGRRRHLCMCVVVPSRVAVLFYLAAMGKLGWSFHVTRILARL